MEIMEHRRNNWEGLGEKDEVSISLERLSTRIGKEWSQHKAMWTLIITGIVCQQENIVRFVVVLLLTGVVNMVIGVRATEAGKGGESPGEEKKGDKEGNKKKGGDDIEKEDIEKIIGKHTNSKRKKRDIGKDGEGGDTKDDKGRRVIRNGKTGEHGKQHPPSGEYRSQHASEAFRQKARRRKDISTQKRRLRSVKIPPNRGRNGHKREGSFTTRVDAHPINNSDSMPTEAGTPAALSPVYQVVAAQAPLPGQPGAPYFDGKDVSRFLRTWERFADRYGLSLERKVNDLLEYCESDTAQYMTTIAGMARDDARSPTEQYGKQWETLKKLAKAKFFTTDREQLRMTVGYLKALSKDKDTRNTSDKVERYIFDFKEVSDAMVEDFRMTEYERISLFVRGLPDRLAKEVYNQAKLDMSVPKTFARENCFKEAVQVATSHNRADADFTRFQTFEEEAEEKPKGYGEKKTPNKILQNPDRKQPSLQTTQSAPEMPTNKQDERMDQILKGMQELQIFHQQHLQHMGHFYTPQQTHAESAYPQYHQRRPRRNPFDAAGPREGMNPRACHWCGNDGHIKVRCPEYQNCLAQGIVHYPDNMDTRTRLGPHGSGGAIVPLPEYSGVWQHVWVDRERRKPESSMQPRIEDVSENPNTDGGKSNTGKLRQLRLEETNLEPETEEVTPFVGALTVGFPNMNLRPGEIRTYVAQESANGEIRGWVEAKRTADDMEDTITVTGNREDMRKRQAREVSYPQVGERAQSPGARQRVSFAEEEEMIVEETPAPESPNTLDHSREQQEDENSDSEPEEPQQKKTRQSRKTGMQQGRKVPIKLRSEAQPERMVDKILDQAIDKITVRELLGLSPDLLREICGIRRLPPLNKTTIPSTQTAATGIQTTTTITARMKEKGKEKEGQGYEGVRVEVRTVRGLKELYACASPTVTGRIEGKIKVKMLIDSGSEMCVMSRDLWEQAKGLLPVDTEIRWSIGSANSTRDRVFGVCHSVMVEVGGIEIPVPVFILEGASQEFILGRTWDRLARDQHDNRDDGSLYISITSLDNRRKATFCAVADHTDRHRDRVRILRLDDEDGEEGKEGCCATMRLVKGYKPGYCEREDEDGDDDENMGQEIGDSTVAEVLNFRLAEEAMGQPIFGNGEGAKELKRQMKWLWRVNQEKEIQDRIAGARRGARVRTLYKKKRDKVVPVDDGYEAGEMPMGEERWRERLIEEEKTKRTEKAEGQYPGVLIPKFSRIKKGERLPAARIDKLEIGENLRPAEKDLLIEMLYNREAAIAFTSTEKGRFHDFIEKPHIIPTIPHKAWQAASFRIPPALKETSIRLIQDRLSCGTIERSFGPYLNPWFMVEKPGYEKSENGELVLDSLGKPIKRYRLINSAQRINAVSIRDASLPPAVEEFSEKFAGYPVVSLIDLFSGYDQCTLDPRSRDITAFHTPLGLMRMTTLPMGYTNAVQTFDRVMRKVLRYQILQGRCEPFLDDIAIKPRSRSTYLDENTGVPEGSDIPGVRRYILEAIQDLDEVIADIERSGGTISGYKSAFICEGLRIVAFVCDSEGRHPVTEKVEKIVNWPACQNVTEARAFIGLCVYYRAWIKDFAVMARPIFQLFRRGNTVAGKMEKGVGEATEKERRRKREVLKEKDFMWGVEQAEAMKKLKAALISAPALRPLVYMPEEDGFVGKIVLGVDASGFGFGAILQQEDRDGRRHPVRYESGLWTPAESRYDAVKLECRGLLRAIKKFRYYLYGVHFLIEIDARTLVHQLNQPTSDLPGTLVGRWLAYIRMFTFDIKHRPGERHKGPDALSRRPGTMEELKKLAEGGDKAVERLEEFIDGELGMMKVEAECSGFCSNGFHSFSMCFPLFPEVAKTAFCFSFVKADYEADKGLLRVAEYLTTMRRPAGMGEKEFKRFRGFAVGFLMREGVLYRRAKADLPPRKVLVKEEDKREVLRRQNDESGHRGRDGTYQKTRILYYWHRLFRDVDEYVRSCSECQRRKPNRFDEPLHPTFSAAIFAKVGLDVVHMPAATDGSKYMVGMRDDLSGWAEYKALRKASSKTVAKFIFEVWMARFGCPLLIVNDGGPENQALTKELLERYKVRNVQVAPYHPQSNGLVERGHQNIVDALAKLTGPSGRPGSWPAHLAAVSWADRVTVRKSTGMTPFRVVFGQECVLPVELAMESWRVMEWWRIEKAGNPRSELIAQRARQLERRPEDLEKAAVAQRNSREANRQYFDKHRRRRPENHAIGNGDLVLLHDTRLDNSHSHKLSDRWMGPYKVTDATRKGDRGTFKLAELDGTELEGYFSGDRVKKFIARGEN